MADQIVVFTSNNARILRGVDPSSLMGEYILINPDLTEVKGIKPHHWKVSEGKIIPMTPSERIARDTDIEQRGADNSVLKPMADDIASGLVEIQRPQWIDLALFMGFAWTLFVLFIWLFVKK